MITGNLRIKGDSISHQKKHSPTLPDGLVEAGDPAAHWLQMEGSSSLLYEIAVKAVELLGVNHSQILVLGSDGIFHCQAYHYSNSAKLNRSTGRRDNRKVQAVLQKIVLSDGPVLVGHRDRMLTAEERSALKSGMQENLLIFPMRLDTEPVGVFILGFDKLDSIHEKIRLAMMFSNQAALAIQREGLPYTDDESVVEIVMALAKALEARDLSTGAHCRKITRLAEQMAMELGCSFREIQAIRRAALLHDIGKIGIPDQILHKPGPLSDREWAIMRQHPEIGARILRMIHGLSDVARLVQAHHERYDGSGYPYNLSGEAIPLGARILSVVDAYGAMMADRVYRPARPFSDAIEELKRCAGVDFDPAVVETFVGLMDSQLDGVEDVG